MKTEPEARGLPRRLFIQCLTATAASGAVWAESDPGPDAAWAFEGPPSLALARQYRADAEVLVFGLRLLRREGVGGGRVLWREFRTMREATLLEFNGFSLPARAAGLNRLGFIREAIRLVAGARQCNYFGLMTSSPEEGAEEAHKALHSNAKEQAYTAIDGCIRRGEMTTAIAHFTAPSLITAERSPELVERAQAALAHANRVKAPESGPESSEPFLHALAGLLRAPQRTEGQFTYSGRLYTVNVSRSADRGATERFRERGLIAATVDAVRVSGRVRRQAGGKESRFNLWIADPAERPLPLRIEYQPKSYLRLAFEASA